jgi:HD-GYP domain-containing protein (c-di-GMP phosphodiesterase class II)
VTGAMGSAGDGSVRLADLLAGLSRLADLGFGLTAGDSMRSAALVAVTGRSLDLSDDDIRASMYTALLLHVGCVGYAHESVRVFGDEFVMNLAAERTDRADPRDVARTLVPALMRGRRARDRLRLAVTAVPRGPALGRTYDTVKCEVGRDAARRLGLSEEVQRSVYHSAEWWNGGGVPAGLAGDDIPVGARVAALSGAAVLLDSVGGRDLAVEGIRHRRGGMLDPGLVDHFTSRVTRLLAEVDGADPYELLLEAEPRPVACVLDPQLVDVAKVFGDLADLKTPTTYAHSSGVASLARDAGQELGLGMAVLNDLEVAGHLHDVGHVAISNLVWEKPGSLTASEWEQVRLHAYHSERILAASPRLSPLARLVGAHHERCDGRGYHRGTNAGELSLPAQVLAAADAYQAMLQRRPHRPALAPEQAEQELRADAHQSRLDGDAVMAVLAAAGHDTPALRRERPAGLTDREVEVLRLVAKGCSNRQIAERLIISLRTAEFHVQQIYRKIGASNRASAAMFTMEHHLFDQDP